jgi:hypothetical protein
MVGVLRGATQRKRKTNPVLKLSSLAAGKFLLLPPIVELLAVTREFKPTSKTRKST